MDWYYNVFEMIDMRSFSNLWFWIALAALWSSVSHWVMGVPWDMIVRARRKPSQDVHADLEALARVSAGRILFIAHETGLLLAGFCAFVFTCLLLLGFVYEREFAQAVFLLGVPMGVVWLLSLRTARRICDGALHGTALVDCLTRHRFNTQIVGIISIFVTAMWGMYKNVSASALGG